MTGGLTETSVTISICGVLFRKTWLAAFCDGLMLLIVIVLETACFVGRGMWCSLVADIAGGKEAEGVWEHGVEQNIWT